MKKYSRQRELILNTLCDNPVHPTAENLYFMVKKTLPDISLATVYRNLNSLKQEGSIISFDCGDDKEHFDANISPHAHLKCLACEQVSDIFLSDNELHCLKGIHEGEFQLVYIGFCTRCNKIKNKSN